MEYYPQLVPLIILIPSIGAFINIFLGAKLGEKWVGTIATVASALAFGVAVLLFIYLENSDYTAAIVNPPLLDGWIVIPSGNVYIPWQQRVDTLSVTMMLIITGIGSLIHVYSMSYMHGDKRYHRYFAYLNMFLAFMLVLVTANNYVMMFVGWEGVGLCSMLLIGFWFDKEKGIGWRNTLAARKAMILNRIGDFGIIISILLIFWTFGTTDYYTPLEIANEEAVAHLAELNEAAHAEESADSGHGEEAGAAEITGDHSEATVVEGEHAEEAAAEGDHSTEGEVVASTEGEHGETAAAAGEEEHGAAAPVYLNNDHIATDDLGVFGQTECYMQEPTEVTIGPFTLSFEAWLTIITLFMLLGVAGKSAQIPLFTWLPDAMAGPTPASALIHAATMVTAGVYIMVRSDVLYHYAPATSFVVTIIGATTAVVGGFIAMGQWDIKRVLAYSTVSQLGFMVAAVGIGAYGAAIFHLVTHAFFKALLFLGSGSVIHAIEHGHHHANEHAHGHDHDESHEADHDYEDEPQEAFDPQDMRNMGGLRHRMPVTFITYLIGTLALAGIFPLAGFWSKDEIIADSWVAGLVDNNLAGYIAFGLLLVAAGFTAFYMWRQIVLVFLGSPRTDAAKNAPESGPMILIPLVILAFFSIFVGFINTPSNVLGLENIFGAHLFTDRLEFSTAYAHAGAFNPVIALMALGISIGAFILAHRIYSRRAIIEMGRDPLELLPSTAQFWSVANARMYWDHAYAVVFTRPFERIAVFLADVVDWRFLHDYVHDSVLYRGFNGIAEILSQPVDLGIIDGAVNGIGRLTRWFSGGLRQIQTGYVRTYALTLLIGVVLVILVILLPLLQRG
jgi:NADH:ubiquinone oxidoreductase subunit 5 (subunit L)/multisubunit Na+/H+ antiporter MnhA subunit